VGPVWLEGVDINRYAYGLNDPVNKSDPNGHEIEDGIDSARDLRRTQKERDEYYRKKVTEYRQGLKNLEKAYDDGMSESTYQDLRLRYEKRIEKFQSKIGRSDEQVKKEFISEFGQAAFDLAISRLAGGVGGKLGISGAPPLRKLHPDSSLSPSSLSYWRGKPTNEIIESLMPGKSQPLRVKPDGTVMDGNTRLKVLEERGIDINSLPREMFRPRNDTAPWEN
jgi:hypothetical protein